MGQLKQKLVHAAMPHTWLIYMLKHKGTRPGRSHRGCKRKSSERKKSATCPKKHSPASILHHKAIDIHFPTTQFRKTSLKACREGPPAKQAYRQENLPHCNALDTEYGQLHTLYKCTMSPTSRKLCSNTDVAGKRRNAHHHLNVPHAHALLGDPCHTPNASKNKIFQLDVKELEMKLNALSAQERWRNTSMSTLPSVAVPSPSLDGELDYSSHPELDSLGTSLQHPSRRDECNANNTLYGTHSTLYCSNPGKVAHGGYNFLRALNFYSSFLEGDQSFITCEERRRALSKTRHAHHLESGDMEALNRLRLHNRRSDLDPKSTSEQGTRYCQSSERKASVMMKNSPRQSDPQAVFGSIVMQSVTQNAKNQKMGYLSSSPIQENVSSKGGSRCVTNTDYEEGYCLDHLRVRSSSDDSDLSAFKMASQNYKSIREQQKQKLCMCMKGRRYPMHNFNDKNNTPVATPVATPVHNDFDDGCLEFRSELFRSLSTQSLDSSLSHNTISSVETSSSLDGNYFKSHQLVPTVSEISRRGFVDATPHSYLNTSILAENEHEPNISVNINDLMLPRRGLKSSEKTICSYALDYLTPRRPAHTAAPVRHHNSSAGLLGGHDKCDEVAGMECQSFWFKNSITGPPPHVGVTGKENMFVYNRTLSTGKKKIGPAKSSITSRLNSLNGVNVTDQANQYASTDHVYIGSSDDNHDDNDENNYADDECSVSKFDSNADRAYAVYYDLMQGEKSGCYDGGQDDLNCLLADNCGISACGYHADGESDEFCASYEESSPTHIDASESIPDATESRIDEMISSKTGLLDRRVQEQQKSHALRDQLLEAEVIWSYNMHQDFKEAMVANIENMSEPLCTSNGGEAHLLELLQYYLALNRRRHHPSIIKAYCDVCEYLKHLDHSE